MRIAAGIILILVAILNIMAGSGYAFAGAVGQYANAHSDEINKAMEAPTTGTAGAAATAADKKAAADVAAATKKANEKLSSVGAGTKYFGFFLLLLAVAQFVAAIMAFVKKGATFLMAIAVLTIVGEVGGMVISHFGVMNIPGLVAGILLFLGAMGMKKPAAAGAPPPAAPAV